LDWNGCLLPHRRHLKVRCQSVFTKTRWTIRCLSHKELGAAYDVPQQVLACVDTALVPFLTDTPAKILSIALECWLPFPLARTSASAITQRVQPKGAITRSASVIDNSYFIPQEWGQSLETVGKAVNADDAEANYMLWDARIWAL
jgi:hypothetical protein